MRESTEGSNAESRLKLFLAWRHVRTAEGIGSPFGCRLSRAPDSEQSLTGTWCDQAWSGREDDSGYGGLRFPFDMPSQAEVYLVLIRRLADVYRGVVRWNDGGASPDPYGSPERT